MGQRCYLLRVLGPWVYCWTRGFVQKVRDNELPGVTFEGVVGKAGYGHKQTRSKAKTQLWIDAVLAKHGTDIGQKLIDS